ncbi:MAG: DUF6882 domain-containing protein, partial [Limisphaerales bacterium]
MVENPTPLLRKKPGTICRSRLPHIRQSGHLGRAARWDLNQDNGVLIFTFPDKKVTCDAQIIGSFDMSRGTWLWA